MSGNKRFPFIHPLLVLCLAGCLFLIGYQANAAAMVLSGNPEASLNWGVISAREPVAIIGSHKSHSDIVVEGLDAGTLVGNVRKQGSFYVRISNPTTSARSIDLRISVRAPNVGGLEKVPLTGDPASMSLNINPGKTIVVDFPFSISQPFWDLLAGRTAGFGMSTLDFVVSATTSPTREKDNDGSSKATPIAPLVDVAHVGYSIAHDARLSPPRAAIRTHQGVPMLEINDRVEPSNFAYVGWNWGIARQSIREFAAADRHIYRIVFQPWSLWQNGKLDPDRFERRMNELVTAIVGNDPQALIYVFWWLHTPKDWADHFPGQTIVYDSGNDATPHPQPEQRGWRRPSIFSKIWSEQQDTIMREAARRLLDSPYADRIFGVSAGYGNGGEWNGYGYHGSQFSDYSEPARREFQAWLKNKYKTLRDLNTAWRSSHRDWDKIDIPSAAQRLATGWGSFTGPDFPAAVTDHHHFVSEWTVDLIEHYSRLFKTASDGRWLVGQFYGYFSSHIACPPYHALDSGHFALGRLLKSDAVDFLIYPYGYMDRWRNLALGNAIASAQIAGKLYVIECDLATHLNRKNNTPILAHHEGGLHDPTSSITAYWRDFSRISTGGLSSYWYDFGRGWYLFPGWTDFVQRVESVRTWQRTHSQANAAEVAVILDEQGAFYNGPQSQPYGKSLYDTLAYDLDESGAPWSAFLASDIDHVRQGNFKVIILLNPVKDASRMAATLRDSNACIVWGYGAGLFENGRWTKLPQPSEKAPAMSVDLDTKVSNLSYAAGIPQIKAPGTTSERGPYPGIFPRVVIDDPRAKPVAYFEDGKVAVASLAQRNADKRDYWMGTPQLEKRLLAAIYDSAGVHRYTRDGSPTYANASSVSIWRPSGGHFKVFLPREASEVRDAWTGEIVARNTHAFTVPGTPGRPTAKLYLLRWEISSPNP